MKKQPSTNLFDLIHSMTGAEKRYFKLNSASYDVDKGYLEIFDIINKQKEYDEKQLIARLNGKYIKNLSYTKNYLQNQILKALCSFNSEDIDDKIREQIEQGKILFRKGLHEFALKILRKARKLAGEHEKFLLELEVLIVEENITYATAKLEEMEHIIQSYMKKKIKILEKETNLTEYQHLKLKTKLEFIKRGHIRSESDVKAYTVLLEHPLIKNKSKALSKRAEYLYEYVYSVAEMGLLNYREMATHFSKEIEIAEAYLPQLIEENRFEYLMALNNLVFAHINLRQKQEAEHSIKKIRNVKVYSEAEKAYRDLIACDLEIQFLIGFGLFEKGGEVSKRAEACFEQYGEHVSPSKRQMGLYNLAYFYFICDEYKNALNCLNELLNMPRKGVREDVMVFSMLLKTIIHYELGHKKFLEYSLSNTYNYLTKKKKQSYLEEFILKIIKKFLKRESKEDTDDQIDYTELLIELEKIENHPMIRQSLYSFDAVSWLKSKISGKSLQEVIQQRSTTV